MAEAKTTIKDFLFLTRLKFDLDVWAGKEVSSFVTAPFHNQERALIAKLIINLDSEILSH